MATSTHQERRLSRAGLQARLRRYRERAIIGPALLLAVCAQLADGTTTALGLAHGASEEMPLPAAIFEAVGLTGGVLAWTLATIAILAGLGAALSAAVRWRYPGYDPVAVRSYYLLFAMGTAVVVGWNLRTLVVVGAI